MAALSILEKCLLKHADGCSAAGSASDSNDWILDCSLQKQIFWSLHELVVLLGIVI